MKLVVNLVLGLNRAVLAEGITLAEALALEPRQTLDILRASAAYSRVMDAKGPKMLEGDFAPQARLSQHLKDVRLILEAAQRTGAALPLSLLHRELIERACAAGLGPLDNSAIIEAFRGARRPARPPD
jgi:3-hydroxyisobutyrate dehydrogenase-like beta-hydroxyacid dehydrogenase